MNTPIYLSLPFRLAADNGQGKDSKAPATMHGVAYSGDAVDLGMETIVIDLETLDASVPMPLLFAHDHGADIGVVSAIDNDGKTLTLTATLFDDVDARAADIVAKARRGMPYQLSVGVFDGSVDQIGEGNTATVNGRTFNGPISIVRGGTLREVSVVTLGADPHTEANIAAHLQSMKEIPMSEAKSNDAGNQSDDATVRLAAQVTELKQQLEHEKQRREEAERHVREILRQARLAAVKELFADVGFTFSEEQAKPYMDMDDETFAVVAAQMRAAAQKRTSGRLFDDANPESGRSESSSISMSLDEIYAKRRIA